MKVNGTYDIPANAITTYELLTDPDVLVRTMPGLKSLKSIGDNHYEAELEVGISVVKGRYKGTVKLEDEIAGEQFRLVMNGQGPLGFVEMNMFVQLEQTSDQQTKVHCEGEASVGGVVAGIGQRMMSGVASMLMGQFFTAMRKEASKAKNAS
ncbi:CoxG family protein [Paenibacillus abyssi]|uniref:Carbon monoxide dehydrogenase n=1 Tax=Paenibacillus abyssi TaxID=1340531 RepID=A0A917D6F3_9BACL|nr:carbon monoxide dehydrogenase subunit G [Paenibacillus abyssi]GGG13627.1 hypothetical protein GCM10010916_33200 [Paenibacillus abyssi]